MCYSWKSNNNDDDDNIYQMFQKKKKLPYRFFFFQFDWNAAKWLRGHFEVFNALYQNLKLFQCLALTTDQRFLTMKMAKLLKLPSTQINDFFLIVVNKNKKYWDFDQQCLIERKKNLAFTKNKLQFRWLHFFKT